MDINNKSSNNHNLQQGHGFAVVSMSMGIIALLLTICYPIAIVLAFVSLVLGILGLIKKQGGMAIAGTILSILAILIALFLGTSSYINKTLKGPGFCNVHESVPHSNPMKYPEDTKKHTGKSNNQLNINHDIGEIVAITENNETQYTITINSVTKVNNEQCPNSIVINYTCYNLKKIQTLVFQTKILRLLIALEQSENTFHQQTIQLTQILFHKAKVKPMILILNLKMKVIQ